MKKVLLTATVQSHIAQFHKPLINMLKENGYEVHVAAKDNLAEKNGLKLDEPDKIFNISFDRSPLSKNNIQAYKQLRMILSKYKYDIIHCNTPVGGVVTRLAAREYRKTGTKVFYTAHGFHFYKGSSIMNWMIYYPVERFLAHITDVLITINKEDFERAKSFKAGMIEYIPGVGIDMKKYYCLKDIRSEKRRKLGIPNEAVVLLSVGELNTNKNFATIIKAIAKIENSNLLYLIRGNGPLEKELEELIEKLQLKNRVKLLGYARDIPEMCAACDIFALPSKREGLGLAALEAMASGKPIITSNIHGIVDYSKSGLTGYSFSPIDVDGFAKGINQLTCDELLRKKMGDYNVEAAKIYDVSYVKQKLYEIYKEVCL